MSKLILLAFSLYAQILCAQSTENLTAQKGFSPKVPADFNVAAVWPAVFAFGRSEGENLLLGSAFSVQSHRLPDRVEALFLTNRHVTDTKCSSDGSCSNSVLAQDVIIDLSLSPERWAKRSGALTYDVRLVAVSPSADVAMIRATFPLGVVLPEPVIFVRHCDVRLEQRYWTIGHPLIYLIHDGGSAVFRDRTLISKRYSSGTLKDFFVQEYSSPVRASELHIRSSIRVLPGNSGGPVFDQSGRVVGLMTASEAYDESSFRFNDEIGTYRDQPNSRIVRCEVMKEFLNFALEKAHAAR